MAGRSTFVRAWSSPIDLDFSRTAVAAEAG
jgi:hypothetical protein